ncbi:OmpA family protein [bacterium]|nr:OmpA family protein [bacterium]
MREIITIVICVVVFLVALQSGLVKTGLDYEVVRKNNENLQAANDRLSKEVKRINYIQQSGADISAGQVAMMERLEKAKEDLRKGLAREVKRREITLEENGDMFQLVLLDKILFGRNSSKILSSSFPLLKKIARVLSHFDEVEIRITGHTDNKPLSTVARKAFPTLRHLSVFRAIAVLKYLEKDGNIDPVQMQTAGYGESRPLVPNDSEYHRTLNGRIVISLHPVQLEQLNKSRDIYRTEKLIPQKKTVPTKASRENVAEEYEPDPDAEGGQPIGEDALESMEDNDFDAGYAVPEALE